MANDPGDGRSGFLDKLQAQVAGSADDVLRVAADAVVVYYLFPSAGTVGAPTKLATVQTILDWRPDSLSLADSEREMLVDAFASGIGTAGIHYLVNQHQHLVFLLTFARGALSGQVDPNDAESCRDYISHLTSASNLQTNSRHILLHLLFPNQFERIAIGSHKQSIVDAFSHEAGNARDLDDALASIRRARVDQLGRDDFDFYEPDIRPLWNSSVPSSELDAAEASNDLGSGSPDDISADQRNDPSWFRTLIEQLYPDPGVRMTCLRQLTESIGTAHEVSRHSWSISLRKTDPAPKLNVGGIQTLCLRENRLDVWVDRGAASDDLWTQLQRDPEIESLWGGGTPRSMTNAFGFSASGNHIEPALETLRSLHLTLVRTTAANQRRTRFRHMHCPGMVIYLRQALGEDVPDPAYSAGASTAETPGRDAETAPRPTDGGLGDESPFVETAFPEIVSRVAAQGMRISDRTLRRYHLALQTRGFVILSGLSGTGKTWLAEVYAGAIGARHTVVPIAPNWTTNEDLLGYHNPITGAYHDTAFSHFLREAAAAWREAESAGHIALPYHVVLDEMNLARVEYYFAKFLSAMELRARSSDDASIELGPGEAVPLPPNLKVIGTVNIDDTTHLFADKIYDRAQLIELEASREDIAIHLSRRPYQDDLLQIWDAVHHIGPFTFRVLDEIAAYVDGAARLGVPWTEALDEQLLQKVLPKIKGADHRVGAGLTQFVALTSGRYPLSHNRATQMLEGFKRHGLASYFG
jgi:hypothetical protein